MCTRNKSAVMQSSVFKRLFSHTAISKGRTFNKLFHNVPENEGRKRNSLQHTFVKYLEESINVRKEAKPTSANDRLVQVKNSEEINAFDLSSIINDLQNLENINDHRETETRLEIIEKQSYSLLHSLSFDDTLLLLNKLLEIVPYRLIGLSIYAKSIDRLRNMLPKESIEPGKIVNLLFLASLPKSAARDVESVLKHLPNIRQLPLIEQCIVSMATFKTGVKLSRENIQTIEDTVHDNLDTLINEPGLFVSLLKALRYNGPSPEFSLALISRKILKNKEKYLTSLAVPILALYAEVLKAENNVVKRLVGDSISHLENSLKSPELNSESFPSVRPKDVSRLLWATTRLNHRLTKDQLNVVENFFDINLNVVSNDPEIFTGIVLSLWILRSPKSHERVYYGFEENIFHNLLGAKIDDRARLNLLLDCVRIEAPGIIIPHEFNDINEKEKPLKFLKELETLNKLLKCLASHFDLRDTQINCPVKSIRIYGVSMKHESLGWIHGDILNSVTCLRETRRPNGLLSLKLRLIKRLGYRSILFDEEDEVEELVTKIEESINS